MKILPEKNIFIMHLIILKINLNNWNGKNTKKSSSQVLKKGKHDFGMLLRPSDSI